MAYCNAEVQLTLNQNETKFLMNLLSLVAGSTNSDRAITDSIMAALEAAGFEFDSRYEFDVRDGEIYCKEHYEASPN